MWMLAALVGANSSLRQCAGINEKSPVDDWAFLLILWGG
jgi:hypothetical protein